MDNWPILIPLESRWMYSVRDGRRIFRQRVDLWDIFHMTANCFAYMTETDIVPCTMDWCVSDTDIVICTPDWSVTDIRRRETLSWIRISVPRWCHTVEACMSGNKKLASNNSDAIKSLRWVNIYFAVLHTLLPSAAAPKIKEQNRIRG